jgi:hypothetical protein
MITHGDCRNIAPEGSGLLVIPGSSLAAEQVHHGHISANWHAEQVPPPQIPLLALEAATFGYTESADVATYLQGRGIGIDHQTAQASLVDILAYYETSTIAQAAHKAFWRRDLLFAPQKRNTHAPDNTLGVLASLASGINLEPIMHTERIMQVRRHLGADNPAHMVRRGYEKRLSQPRRLLDFPIPPWTACTVFATDLHAPPSLDPPKEAAVRALAAAWHADRTRSLRDSENKGESSLASTVCTMIALQKIDPPDGARGLPGEAARTVLPYIACDMQIASIAHQLGITQKAVIIRAEQARQSGPYRNILHTLAGMFALHLFVTATIER